MPNYSLPFYGQYNFGKITATAATPYRVFVPPMPNAACALAFVQILNSTTAQNMTVMRPLSSQNLPNQSGYRCSCYLTSAAAAAQTVMNINQDPGVYTAYTFRNSAVPRTANNVIAASDYLAFQYPDGTWGLDVIASVSTLAITMTANFATGGLAIGAPVWFFGVPTDTDPYDAAAQPIFPLAASSRVNFGDEPGVAGFISTYNYGEPLLIYVSNETAASVLQRGTAIYLDRGSPYWGYA